MIWPNLSHFVKSIRSKKIRNLDSTFSEKIRKIWKIKNCAKKLWQVSMGKEVSEKNYPKQTRVS